jgi:hypothetical protein
MVQLGSMAHRHVGSLGTITVIAAELRWVECDVSKAGGQYIY